MPNKLMRILLTGGGTGGHIFPLIAVARNLKNFTMPEGEAAEFLFVGPDGFSKSVFRNEGISVKGVLAAKFRRYFSPLNFIDLFKLPIGFIQAYWHLFWFMPDVVFAKGGYGSVPVVFVAWLFRIPVAIHESDIIPGLANKVLAKFARKILVSFDYTLSFFPRNKTLFLGNPIREELFYNVPKNARELFGLVSEKPLVLILGGSQGAQEINNLVLLALPDIVKKYEIIHQCGENNLDMMKKGKIVQLKTGEERALYHAYGNLNEQEMASAYYLASIIVSRSGAGAIFEIAASGKPSIMIPYFAAAGAHQFKNAEVYEAAGACRILRGKNLLPHLFINEIDDIVNSPETWQAMSQAALAFAKPNAASQIAEEVLKLAI